MNTVEAKVEYNNKKSIKMTRKLMLYRPYARAFHNILQ